MPAIWGSCLDLHYCGQGEKLDIVYQSSSNAIFGVASCARNPWDDMEAGSPISMPTFKVLTKCPVCKNRGFLHTTR